MSFPQYESYKDSGVKWLGEMPNHWKITPIKSVAKLFGRIGYRGYTTADIVEEGAGAITLSPSNMSEGNISLDKSTYISWEKYHESPEIKVSYGDIIMVKTGSTLGKVAVVRQDNIPAITINPQLVIFKKIVCNPIFLFYSMLESRIQSEIEVNNTGSSIPTLTQECIGNIAIPLPSIEEQKTIAAFLDRETAKIDALIAEQQRLIELLKEKRQAVISHAVTKGLTNLPGANLNAAPNGGPQGERRDSASSPDAPMKDSGIAWLGEVPAHWEIGAIKRFVNFLDGRRIPLSSEERGSRSGDFPYYGASGIIDWIDEYIFDEDLVLVSEDGANLINRSTRIAFVATGRYWVNNHAHIIKPIDNNLTYWAERIEAIDLIPFITGSAQPKLTVDALANLMIAIPPSKHQRAEISEFINKESHKLDTLTTEAQQAIDLLKERRSALISAAVTGKIDVRGLAETLPESVTA